MPTDPDKTPTQPWGARELLRDSTRPPALIESTGETCPACAGPNGAPGDGIVRKETASGYSAMQCELCRGEAFVSPAHAMLWRECNAVSG